MVLAELQVAPIAGGAFAHWASARPTARGHQGLDGAWVLCHDTALSLQNRSMRTGRRDLAATM
jgi:hypothetical protein